VPQDIFGISKKGKRVDKYRDRINTSPAPNEAGVESHYCSRQEEDEKEGQDIGDEMEHKSFSENIQ
jgi:hypothetical protein